MADTVDSDRVREYTEDNDKALEEKIDRLAELIRKSKYTVFFTGAGVSTSAGVGDYRGPTGAWTMRKIKQLRSKKASGSIDAEESAELQKLETEAAREQKKSKKKVSMNDAQPTATHMAMATLMNRNLAHFCITTNLDGIFRKAGMQGHTQLCCLHGDIYIERCTACGYDWERNYHVRQDSTHVHDHKIGTCGKCGSKPPKTYTGRQGSAKMKGSKWPGLVMIGTHDVNCGTKDTHINFGECLDEMDWDEADLHCGKADLCIVAGTSMSLRHITHFPFKAKKVVIINLQATPDDEKCHLRIWAQCDPVFVGLMERLGVELDPIPVWRPRDSVPIKDIPKWVDPYYVECAKRLEEVAKEREKELKESLTAKTSALSVSTETKTPAASSAAAPSSTSAKTKSSSSSSSSSPLPSFPTHLLIGNLHKLERVDADADADDDDSDRNKHRWTLFVRSNKWDLSQFVENVEYRLHPTFSPSVVKVSKSPYHLSRLGWGTFVVTVVVNWKSNYKKKPFAYDHALKFDRDETVEEVEL